MGIAFFEIQISECKILKAIDLCVFSQPTIFDFIRSLACRLKVHNPGLLDSYYRYIDNLYLYALMSDQYRHDMGLVCLMFTAVYFTARKEPEILNAVYCTMSRVYGAGNVSIRRTEEVKGFIMKKLGELGTSPEDIANLNAKMDLSSLMT